MKRHASLEDPYLRLLLYGKPGSTKTRTSGTAALCKHTEPVLWLNASGNPVSIRDYEKHPDIIDIERLKDLNDPYNWIMQGQDPKAEFAKKFELRPPYKALVVDQITDVQRMSYAMATGNQKMLPGDTPKPHQIQQFQMILGQTVNFAKLYFELPLHVIMTALEKDATDKVGNVYHSPMLIGQSSTEVPGYATIVGRLQHVKAAKPNVAKSSKAKISVGHFTEALSHHAKDNFGRLPSVMGDPTICDILDLILAP